MNYDDILARKHAGFAGRAPAPYSYVEEELDTRFAFRAEHSTLRRAQPVIYLPDNFPLYSSIHSASAAGRAAAAPRQAFCAGIDYRTHVLELLQEEKGEGAGGGDCWLLLFGEWARGADALRGIGSPRHRVRCVGVADFSKPISQELDWLDFLRALRADIPLHDRLLLFFDWPHAAANARERLMFLKLQLAALYVLHPDRALLRVSLPSEQSRNLLYAKGRLVLPATDRPTPEQLLLRTTADDYDSAMEIYASAKIRDQFLFFARETLEKVDYRGAEDGLAVNYLVYRQQRLRLHPKMAMAMETEGRTEGETAPLTLPAQLLQIGGVDGHVSIAARAVDRRGRLRPVAEMLSEEEDAARWEDEGLVRLLHMGTGVVLASPSPTQHG